MIISWLAVWFISSLVEYTHHASVWFPPAGLTFATLFIVGVRAAPVLMIAAILATVLTNSNYQINLANLDVIQSGLLFGLAHIIPYYLGSRLLLWLTETKQLTLPQSILSFLLIAAVSTLIATTLVLSALIVSDMMSIQEVSETWLPFWIGDLAGLIILSPLFFSVLRHVYPKRRFEILKHVGNHLHIPSPQYKYKIMTSLTLVILAMVLANLTQSIDSSFAIFFLVLPHMWIACTENAFYNIFSLALSSVLVVFLVDYLDLMDFIMVYQYAINVVATNALFAIAIPTLTADNQQLKIKVFTDSLTKASSREHLVLQGEIELVNCKRNNQSLCMLVFDIDHFKKINDTHGHNTGDEALKTISNNVKQLLRPFDLFGRFGGDEFVLLLPNTDGKTAMTISQRLLIAINNIQIIDGKNLSTSIGVAKMELGDNFDSLFARADQALYQAKNSGRNCVFQHSE
ncbi:MAG: diguanylate cyclase [Paraglaciecola sp.]|uniref:GGDEF domain-containing protein n=2 Tax=Paraglaciecola sp. TaxID=1920173 RepID=UPI0032663B9D